MLKYCFFVSHVAKDIAGCRKNRTFLVLRTVLTTGQRQICMLEVRSIFEKMTYAIRPSVRCAQASTSLLRFHIVALHVTDIVCSMIKMH